MSKLSFRARALDASKPMPIYMAEELPDLPDYSAINRAVPQMPSGMEKEEECEHHLQRAICAGLIIPTPEVSDLPDREFYDKVYPANYKQPRQLIHMQPFTMEQDIPDYDMDSEDERWLQSQAQRLELSPLKFEEMMDRLEKSSGQTVVTLNEAKALLKEDDDLIIAVFDYWLNKRLKTQHPLILTVKTEQRAGIAANNPYLAFRRRTEKMQTRKNRKNDETSYEKMLKLRRDLCRAVTLLELVKKREKMKREHVHLTIEIFEKRYQCKDFNGAIYAEASAIKTTQQQQTTTSRPAFTPIFHNHHYTNQNWSATTTTTQKPIIKDEIIPRKEKRQYKKRKHKSLISGHTRTGSISGGIDSIGVLSSDDESMVAQLSPAETDEVDDEGQFAFRRNKLCSYHMPLPTEGNWPWCSKDENGMADKRFRFTLTSLSNPRRCIGFARRRIGRGGRVILDRITTDHDDFWRTLDFSIVEPNYKKIQKCSSLTTTTTTTIVDDNSNDNNFISNTDNNLNINNTIRTDIKSDFSHSFDNNNSKRTTNSSDFPNNESDNINVKVEIDDDSSGVGGRRLAYNNNHNNNYSNDINCNNNNNRNCSNINDNIVNTTPSVARTKHDEDEMIEILRSIQRDWLHFRPKTPPSDYEPPCHMLPANDNYFIPNMDTTFSIELQPLETTSTLLDSSTFLTEPFNFDSIDNLIDVPVTDTRQSQQQQQQSSDRFVQTGINLNVNVGLNTLNSSSVNDNNNSVNSNINNINDCLKENDLMILDDDYNDKRTLIGCSRFRVSDLNQSSNITTILTSTTITTTTTATATTTTTSSSITSKLNNNICCNSPTTTTTINTTTSPKFNNINDGKFSITTTNRQNNDSSLSNTNGLLTQLVLDGRTKNNKMSYAYTGGVGYSNASSGTLSLHTSAHSLTLNSHSANILEIPINDDSETTTNKLVNSSDTTTNPTTNNKTKTIVRKNNLVMEVT